MKFLTPEQARDWDFVANHYEEIENINEEQKDKAKKAILFLKEELGKNYLKEIDADHPIYFNIINHVVTTRLWFIDFASDIKRLREFPNYKALQSKLIKPNRFPEAFSELELAIKFCKSGFNIEFEPIVQVNNRQKVPDLKVTNCLNEESFNCEVSISKLSDIAIKAEKIEYEIFIELQFPNFLESAGRVEKMLSDGEKKEIIEKIRELKKEVNEKTGFGELVIKGLITLGIATKENEDKLVNWAKDHKCELKSFTGPPYEVDELKRMKNKLRQEWKQLPYDEPNLIMIYDNDFFYTSGDALTGINQLEDFLTGYKNINGIIIRGKYVGTIKPCKVMIKEHTYIQKYQYDNYAEQYLILWNKKCQTPLKLETTNRIIESIIKY